MIVPSRAAALLPLLALGACSNSMQPLEAHLGDDGIWSLVIVKPGTTGTTAWNTCCCAAVHLT